MKTSDKASLENFYKMTFCLTDFLFYQKYFLATKIIDKYQCQSGCYNITWDIGHGQMPFLQDFEGMFFLQSAFISPIIFVTNIDFFMKRCLIRFLLERDCLCGEFDTGGFQNGFFLK